MLKKVMRFLWSPFLTVIILSAVFFWYHGIPLWGLPDEDDIQSVEIFDARYGETKRLEDRDDIHNARNVAGVLNYKLGKSTETGEAKLEIKITYWLKNGGCKIVSANENTVLWNGKRRAIRRDGELFMNLVEGMFFDD